MTAQDHFWNRDELYREVWSTPMKVLATKYGISDVALAKTCRKLIIPLPGRGYWAKKQAGIKVKQQPLPAVSQRILLPRRVPQQDTPQRPKLSEYATTTEVAQVEQLEGVVGELPLKRGSLSHPLIVQARTILSEASPDQRKILRTGQACLDIRVSKDALDRALRIMAGLLTLIEDAGFTVSVENDNRQETAVKIHGQSIRFGVVESVSRIELATPIKGSLLERVLTFAGKPVEFQPSGKLSIEAWTSYGSHRGSWKDGKSRRLEEHLSKVVAGFIRFALVDKAEKHRKAEEEREQRRLAEEAARLEELIEIEQSKVNALKGAAARWSQAERIRAFISAAKSSAPQNGHAIEPGTVLGDWIAWAESQADRLDPLKESPTSILDRAVEIPQAPSYYGYNYRKPPKRFRLPKPIWRMK